jgi:hypothetical protein
MADKDYRCSWCWFEHVRVRICLSYLSGYDYTTGTRCWRGVAGFEVVLTVNDVESQRLGNPLRSSRQPWPRTEPMALPEQ